MNMKVWKFSAALFAALALFNGCSGKDDEDSSVPAISVSAQTLEMAQDGGTATFTVTSNRDWTIVNGVDWLAFEPSSGKASDNAVTVTVTALANASKDRETTIKVSNQFDYKTIFISQPGQGGSSEIGEGTKDSPYNVAKALAIIAAGTYTDADVYVKGKISQLGEFGASFGNYTYYISDDGTATTQLEVYRGYYLGGVKFTASDQIKVGDDVIVKGKLVNFNGKTPEITSGSRLVYLNGQVAEEQTWTDLPNASGEGTEASPYNVAKSLNIIHNGQAADSEVYVKGKISKLGEFSDEFGNYTYYISDDGKTENELEVFRGYYLKGNKFTSADQLKVGDEVVVSGKLVYYNNQTAEITSGSKIVSLNGETGGSDEPEEIKDVTLAEFLAAEVSTTVLYRITGKITSIKNSTYGNLYIANKTDTVYVYGVKANKDAANNSFGELNAAVGDTLTVVGHRGVFKETKEMVDGYCEKLVKGSGSGGDNPGGSAEQFASNIKWTNGTNAYDNNTATVNGVKDVKVFKIGTSKNAGTATITIPAGTKKVSYYGVAWKGAATTIVINYNGAEVYSQALAANDGASNNSPFTITVTDSDHYTFDLTSVVGAEGAPADLTATITTKDGAKPRALFFGMKAEK